MSYCAAKLPTSKDNLISQNNLCSTENFDPFEEKLNLQIELGICFSKILISIQSREYFKSHLSRKI